MTYFRVNGQEGHCEQALDRGQIMAYLQGEYGRKVIEHRHSIEVGA